VSYYLAEPYVLESKAMTRPPWGKILISLTILIALQWLVVLWLWASGFWL
jgi:hypothetical protein